MRLFGFDITINKALPPTLLPPNSGFSNWFNVIRESYPGAWQRNVEIRLENVLTFSAVYACVTLISSDIGKLCLRLVEQNEDEIWEPVENPAFSPILRKPNHFQTRQKFIENWIASKLIHGNTYVLKERDNRNVVVRMYVLNPHLTRVLLAPDGSVFYQLATNLLAGVNGVTGIDLTEVTNNGTAAFIVPASEIIHDVNVPLYHPLCGVSPITACGLAAVQGLAIQNNSAKFFANGSRPGGILTAPGAITDETAKRLKDYWDQNFTGENAGKIAVLGDGLAYDSLSVTAQDSQLINQLKWTSETVCTAFHMPPYMIGVGQLQNNPNVEATNLQYYSQCLQPLMEAIEALLDEGLGLVEANQQFGTEFDLDDLLKMDTATQYRTYGEGITKGLLAPNEGRKKIGYGPVEGGDTPYLQQQQFSLAALNKRDSKADPFGTNKPAPQPALPAPKPAPTETPKPPADAAEPPPPQDQQLHMTEWHAALKREFDHVSAG